LVAALKPNYPNPFNPETTIPYTVGGNLNGSDVRVTLAIYDVLGQTVRWVVDERLKPGAYRAVWDGRDQTGRRLASGMYFYRLEAGAFNQTRRLMLLR
jgi:flagellar hook assembly protein FlgD